MDRIDEQLCQFPRLAHMPGAVQCEHGGPDEACPQQRTGTGERAAAQVPRKPEVPRLSARTQGNGGSKAARSPPTLHRLRRQQQQRHGAQLQVLQAPALQSCQHAQLAANVTCQGLAPMQAPGLPATGSPHASFPLLQPGADQHVPWQHVPWAWEMWPGQQQQGLPPPVAALAPSNASGAAGVWGAEAFPFTQASLLHAAALQSMREARLLQGPRHAALETSGPPGHHSGHVDF